MHTSQKIIDSSIRLFGEFGYLGTSTKAIAEAAGISEMTLFRKFKTKQNLFDSMLKYTLGNELTDNTDINMNQNVYEFTKQVLDRRLLLVSKHINLVQMIIRESLIGRLSSDLNFIETMSKKLTELFDEYGKMNHLDSMQSISDYVLSTVIRYAVLDYKLEYCLLTKMEQENYLQKCLWAIKL